MAGLFLYRCHGYGKRCKKELHSEEEALEIDWIDWFHSAAADKEAEASQPNEEAAGWLWNR